MCIHMYDVYVYVSMYLSWHTYVSQKTAMCGGGGVISLLQGSNSDSQTFAEPSVLP